MAKSIFTKEQDDFMIQNYLNMEYKEIGNILGFTERQIRGRLNNMGYTKYRKINADYFSNIDTPLKAYLLGFIFADGWIVCNPINKKYEFGMELQSGDKYVLDKINDVLGGLNIIKHSEPGDIVICGKNRHKNDTDILRVYSKQLVENLIKNGITTNKSQKDIFPIVEDNLFFDWLRGYIDGDGCFYVNKTVNIYMHITCATEPVLIYIKDVLDLYDIKTSIYHYNDEKKYRLMCTNKKSMINLVNHLYYEDDLFCLSRKYEIIKKLLCLAA